MTNPYEKYVRKEEGTVLALVYDYCRSHTLNFEELYCEAYPEDKEHPMRYRIESEDMAHMNRDKNRGNLQKILLDLEDINYHSLAAALARKTFVSGVIPLLLSVVFL